MFRSDIIVAAVFCGVLMASLAVVVSQVPRTSGGAARAIAAVPAQTTNANNQERTPLIDFPFE